MQTITVELLGVARLLARRETVEVAAERPITLVQLLEALLAKTPALAGSVIGEDGALLGGYVLSRDGVVLLRDGAEIVAPGERLLLLSTSAGG